MGTTDQTQRIYFKNLDVLRFLAAYMIVILHAYFGWKAQFGEADWVRSMSPGVSGKMETVLHNFSIGVDVFFVISGFLITYLLLAEREKMGKVDVVRFWIRRAFRIWPLYFLILLVGPLLTYFYNEQEPGYLYHFFFLGNFDIMYNGTKSVATDHLWSICVEEHFYLICPLLMAFVPLKRLPQVLLFIIGGSILYRGYLSAYVPFYGSTLYVHTLSRVDVLAIGSLLGYLAYFNLIRFNHSVPVRMLVYGLFLFIFINEEYNNTATFFTATVKKYFFVTVIVYWIGNFMFNPTALFPIKKQNILHQFGKATYGIYMFNPIVVFILVKAFAKYQISSYLLFALLVHAGLALVCYLSYKYFEMPFLQLKEKYAVVKSGGVVAAEEETTAEIPEVAAVSVSDKSPE